MGPRPTFEQLRARRQELRDDYWQHVLRLDKRVRDLQEMQLDFIAANCDRLIQLMQDMKWNWDIDNQDLGGPDHDCAGAQP